jgi:electron transfer flavoprotein alpha subunit
MATVLIVVETAGGNVRTASLPAVSFGKLMAEAAGAKLELLVIGAGSSPAAAEAAKLGADVVLVDDARLEHYLAETYAPVVAQAAKERGATVVAATGTSLGKDLLPRVAALLDAPLVADVIGVIGANTFKRPMLAGNVIEHVEVAAPIVCATIRQTEFPPAQAGGAAGTVNGLTAAAVDAHGAEFVSLSTSKSERPELTEAKIVVSGGRGMREGKNFEQVVALADLLGGAMGASRAACDAGMVPNDLQVGQTGKVVAPQLYVAIAISGAIQHLAGMKGSKTIVAINKDPEAPIFQVADYGLVTTWEKAIPELSDEIKKLQASQR